MSPRELRETSSEDLRRMARESHQRSADSFERCDTDGFLSQWASDITGRLLTLQAEINDNGGVHEFACLCDLEGRPVRAKNIRGKYGWVWAIMDEFGNFTGEFIGDGLSEKSLARKGYTYGTVTLPAYAEIKGSGYGLAGAASAFPGISIAFYAVTGDYERAAFEAGYIARPRQTVQE